MEQIVERKKKPVIKIFLLILLSVIFIDFIIFLMNKFNDKLPYTTTLITMLLVIFCCSYILIKYFSKYSYTLEEDHLVFHRIIGSKRFEMLRIHYSDLIRITSNEEIYNLKKPTYKFIFDKNPDPIYIGKFKYKKDKRTFLFSPNDKLLNHLKKAMNMRSEKNG